MYHLHEKSDVLILMDFLEDQGFIRPILVEKTTKKILTEEQFMKQLPTGGKVEKRDESWGGNYYIITYPCFILKFLVEQP